MIPMCIGAATFQACAAEKPKRRHHKPHWPLRGALCPGAIVPPRRSRSSRTRRTRDFEDLGESGAADELEGSFVTRKVSTISPSRPAPRPASASLASSWFWTPNTSIQLWKRGRRRGAMPGALFLVRRRWSGSPSTPSATSAISSGCRIASPMRSRRQRRPFSPRC
jgi:hypothetical protein